VQLNNLLLDFHYKFSDQEAFYEVLGDFLRSNSLNKLTNSSLLQEPPSSPKPISNRRHSSNTSENTPEHTPEHTHKRDILSSPTFPFSDNTADKFDYTLRFSYSYLVSANFDRTLPNTINTRALEWYLSDDEFRTIFGCTKEIFYSYKTWRQMELRKMKRLF